MANGNQSKHLHKLIGITTAAVEGIEALHMVEVIQSPGT